MTIFGMGRIIDISMRAIYVDFIMGSLRCLMGFSQIKPPRALLPTRREMMKNARRSVTRLPAARASADFGRNTPAPTKAIYSAASRPPYTCPQLQHHTAQKNRVL